MCWTKVYHTWTITNLNYVDTKLTWNFLSFKRPCGTVKNTSSCSIHIPSELLNFLALLTMSSKFLTLALISTFRNMSTTLPNCLSTSTRITESHSHLSRHSPITVRQKKKSGSFLSVGPQAAQPRILGSWPGLRKFCYADICGLYFCLVAFGTIYYVLINLYFVS